MKTLYYSIIVGLSLVILPAFATNLEFSSTPENATTFSYTDNTSQLQFIIPAIIAIVSIVAGMAIYAGAKTR